MEQHTKPATRLVLDTNVFIEYGDLMNIHRLADRFYTTPDVLAEVKDKRTAEAVASFPFELNVRPPIPADVALVAKTARDNNELRHLSDQDLGVIAVTYRLHTIATAKLGSQPVAAPIDAAPARTRDLDEWITPSNIGDMTDDDHLGTSNEHVPVACFTGDRAMQNVMLALGVRVISPDGKVLSHIRRLCLKCSACEHIITGHHASDFCPKCGNKGHLMKVAQYTLADGSVTYSKGIKNFNRRGQVFALPAPRGGKGAINPVLVEDATPEFKRALLRGETGAAKDAGRAAQAEAGELGEAAALRFLADMRGPGAAAANLRPVENWERRNPNETRRRRG